MTSKELNDNVKRLKDEYPEYAEYADEDIATFILSQVDESEHNTPSVPTVVAQVIPPGQSVPFIPPHPSSSQISTIIDQPPHSRPAGFWRSLIYDFLNDPVAGAKEIAEIGKARAETAGYYAAMRQSQHTIDTLDNDKYLMEQARQKDMSPATYQTLKQHEEMKRLDFEYACKQIDFEIEKLFKVRFLDIAEAHELTKMLLGIQKEMANFEPGTPSYKMLEMIDDYGQRRLEKLLKGEAVSADNGDDEGKAKKRNTAGSRKP